MAFQRKRALYEALPVWVKGAVRLVPFGWVSGRAYRETMARGAFFDRASREDILAYKERRLGEVLAFAVDQVPAYRAFRTVVERHRPAEALKAFPLLDKDALQADMPRFLPRDFDRIPHYELTTGGTSGSQLRFYVDDDSQAVENAFQHRLWRRVGYSIHARRVTFRGVPFPSLKDGVYWQHNAIYNELQFSPFHMNEDSLGSYVRQIERFRPSYIYGYPSAIDRLGEYVLRTGLQQRLPRLEAALLISEGVTPAQRFRIERAFATRVLSFYGHSERVIMGGECERTTAYHQFPDYGALEIVSPDSQSDVEEGEQGELVGTGFLNRSLPLIRYRTGDLATRLPAGCACGRHWDRFTDVEGRWKQDHLLGNRGTRISLTALNMHGAVFDKVIRYQYHQERPGSCELRLMVTPDFSEADAAAILRSYAAKLGESLELSLRIVDSIPLTARGKLKLLDSCLCSPPRGEGSHE